MATGYTTNYHLAKPDYTDPADVAVLNNNMDIIDQQLLDSRQNVKEYNSVSAFPATGAADRIYVAKDTNLLYRWNGSAYVEVSKTVELGETSTTAYRGDRGKAAYDHANAKGSAFASGLYKITTNEQGHVTSVTPAVKGDIGLGNVDNTSDLDKPVSTATQAAINAVQFSTISTQYIDSLFAE